MVLLRNNIAHLHRPWRATLRLCAIPLSTVRNYRIKTHVEFAVGTGQDFIAEARPFAGRPASSREKTAESTTYCSRRPLRGPLWLRLRMLSQSVIAPRRTSSAHLHRPWRANRRLSATALPEARKRRIKPPAANW